MRIDQNKLNNTLLFAVQGRLDGISASQLREQLNRAIQQECRIVVDLSEVVFMDSSGLGSLVAAARQIRLHNGDIKLACPSESVHRVFELTQADRLFDIYDNPESAAASFVKRS